MQPSGVNGGSGSINCPADNPVIAVYHIRAQQGVRSIGHRAARRRVECDPALGAEYAEAMLEGAIFPPIVIFQDKNGWKHLADGHHRVDATALAALKDNRRKAEVLAEIRHGTVGDALRYAMQANRLHGKRMTDADHKRAIGMAIDHHMILAINARDVVPEVVDLVGCSIRTAQVNTAELRREMIQKRDRLIVAVHREGRTQEAIGAELGVPKQTVSDVISRLSGKRNAAETVTRPAKKRRKRHLLRWSRPRRRLTGSTSSPICRCLTGCARSMRAATILTAGASASCQTRRLTRKRKMPPQFARSN